MFILIDYLTIAFTILVRFIPGCMPCTLLCTVFWAAYKTACRFWTTDFITIHILKKPDIMLYEDYVWNNFFLEFTTLTLMECHENSKYLPIIRNSWFGQASWIKSNETLSDEIFVFSIVAMYISSKYLKKRWMTSDLHSYSSCTSSSKFWDHSRLVIQNISNK